MTEITNLFPKEGELTATDDAEIIDAVTKAYPNKDFLSLRIRHKWGGLNVADEIVSMDKPGKIIVSRIYEYAKAEGRALDFLALAWTDKPLNPKLKALAERFFPDRQAVTNKYVDPEQPAPVAPPPRAPLEEIVDKRSKFVGIADFSKRLEILSGALCRVGIPHVNGTGFLIGKKTVLTNFHVVKKAIESSKTGDRISCEFDYHDESAPTVKSFGKSGTDWIGPYSPYSTSDLTGRGTPADDELDFAVIHLEEPVDDQRKAISLPLAPPIVAQRDFVLIGQHPGGDVAQLAPGVVVEFPNSGLRYRYDVTTKKGSSGSPVFNFDLQLIALHHAADPDQNPEYNQGVPIWHVMKAIKDAGLDLANL